METCVEAFAREQLSQGEVLGAVMVAVMEAVIGICHQVFWSWTVQRWQVFTRISKLYKDGGLLCRDCKIWRTWTELWRSISIWILWEYRMVKYFHTEIHAFLVGLKLCWQAGFSEGYMLFWFSWRGSVSINGHSSLSPLCQICWRLSELTWRKIEIFLSIRLFMREILGHDILAK